MPYVYTMRHACLETLAFASIAPGWSELCLRRCSGADPGARPRQPYISMDGGSNAFAPVSYREGHMG